MKAGREPQATRSTIQSASRDSGIVRRADVLQAHAIRISMDGHGQCHDNIFVEGLWWTVKHERVYLRPAANGSGQ